jgi:predicted RNA polymerase sigma factor
VAARPETTRSVRNAIRDPAQWPGSGVPDNPGAWLMATAKHRAIDRLCRNARLDRKQAELGRELRARRDDAAPDLDAELDDEVADDLLRLMLICCHPLLSTEARVALTRYARERALLLDHAADAERQCSRDDHRDRGPRVR